MATWPAVGISAMRTCCPLRHVDAGQAETLNRPGTLLAKYLNLQPASVSDKEASTRSEKG
jgi:hypothetical protein